jgi:polysaccharide chain length determinant protein (PEP-CTERM system associated)
VERELTLAEYVAILRRRWGLVLVTTLIGPVLAYGVSKFLPNKFMSQTLVLVEPATIKIDRDVEVANVSQQLASMKPEILSRSRLEPVILKYGVFPEDVNKVSMDQLVGRLQGAIGVTPVQPITQNGGRDLPGFFISVTLDNARTAQAVCTAITSMFIEKSIDLQNSKQQLAIQFWSRELETAKADLDAQDAKLAAFQSQHIGSGPGSEQTNLNLLTNLTSQLDAATQALARAQQDKSFAESMLQQQIASWQASQGGRNPDTLQQQLAALQTQLAGLEARYTSDYPDVIKTKADIAALQKKIAESESVKSPTDVGAPQKTAGEPAAITQWRTQVHIAEQTIAEKTKQEEQVREQIKLYQSRVQASPTVEEEFKELTRGYQTALESYNQKLKDRDTALMTQRLNSDQEGVQYRVLDPASLPSKPSFPNRPMFALGGLGGGLALGLGLAFFLELKDNSLRTERDAEFALRLPVLAMIPAIEPITTKKPSKKRAKATAGSGLGLGARA